MKKLLLDTILTLMRREQILGHGFGIDELVQIFVQYVKDPLSREDVEFSLAHYLAKSKITTLFIGMGFCKKLLVS
jgi:hypothetical protein